MKIFVGTVTSKGQITIPVHLRNKYAIVQGDSLIFKEEDEGLKMVKAKPLDVLYLRSVEASLCDEWETKEDNQAYNDL